MRAEVMRLAELAGVLSLIADAAMGMPADRGLRTALVATRLAACADLSVAERSDAFYVGLLKYAGCTAESEVLAAVTGDEVAFGQFVYGIDLWRMRESLPAIVRAATSGRRGVSAAQAAVRMFAQLPRLLDTIHAHCDVARAIAAELGLPARTQELLELAFERWDGKGVPGRLRGDRIAPALRCVHAGAEIEAGHRAGGVDGARVIARKRARRAIDPELADLFDRHAGEICAALDASSTWAVLLDAEPTPHAEASPAIVRAALRTMGHVADLRSACRRGHADAVATLARGAARELGLAAETVELVERAGFVHDIGTVVVSTLIWNKPGALTEPERERVRLHAYIGERLLARAPVLAPLAAIAITAHERLDGGGYHRCTNASGLSTEARVLAAADVYRALTERRAYRRALAPRDAAALVQEEVRAGKLCGSAAAAVLASAGQSPAAPAPVSGALTARELEVVALLVRGMSNKEISRELGVAASTAGHHVERIFIKLGVRTRAAAAVLALQRGLVRP